MSKRSRRKHRQQNHKKHAPRPEQPAVPAETSPPSQGRTTGRALWIGGAVLVVVAVLYAVNGGGRRKGEIAAGSVTNPAPPAPLAAALPLLAATPSAASVAGGSGPKIVFATPVYDFGQIKGGEVVKYTYVFTNVGSAMLEVTNVHASCGCTTAGEWTRQVAPGQTGSIPIQFNSGSFSGAVGKAITVSCNDANQPTVTLQIKGSIWKPIDVTPQYAVLNVTADAPSNSTTVRIVNNLEEPLTLFPPTSVNPALAAELRTNQPGKEFELIVRTVPPLPAGTVQGQISVKTSSTNMPILNVSAWVNVQQAVIVAPSQITLPAAPLAKAAPFSVSIRNNGTTALALTEPAVNAKGVDVQVKELQPGRYFVLTLGFPAGFEIAPGEKVELSVKSNHPQFPIIKVPIIQPPRPAVSVVPLGPAAVSQSASQ